MQIHQVVIETIVNTDELQSESDRVGNDFLHSDTESGHVIIDSESGDEVLMMLWLDSIRVREEQLKERNAA